MGKAQARRSYTPNQVVAYNLRRAREHRGWTQREAAERLAEFGVKWSLPSFSVAETSVEPGARVREFDAAEILAMAQAFEVPVTWFFLPPDPALGEGVGGPGPEQLPVVTFPGGAELSGGDLVRSVLFHPAIAVRIAGLRPYLESKEWQELQRFSRNLVLEMVKTQAGRLDEWMKALESVTNFFKTAQGELAKRVQAGIEASPLDSERRQEIARITAALEAGTKGELAAAAEQLGIALRSGSIGRVVKRTRGEEEADSAKRERQR